MSTELLQVPGLLDAKKYAEAVAIVQTAKPHKAFAERLDRAIAMVLPHAGAAAKPLYARVKNSPFPYVHHLLAAYAPSHVARFLELAPMAAALHPKDAKKALAERAKLDPHGRLAGLLDNAAAMDSLFLTLPAVSTRDPGPHRRPKPLSTDLRPLWGREPPGALAAWVNVLDHWDLGYHELGAWQAWNEGPSHRSWNPPLVPPANVNTIEWALKLQGATRAWNERRHDATLNLLFASCMPIGRIKFTHAELGMFMGSPAEILEIDREHDVRRIVAPDLDTFVGIAPRMKPWKPKPVKSRSRAVQMATRAGWIVDLLDIPQLAAIVASYRAHADHELGALDEPGDALYWLFHSYFTGDDTALAHVVAKTQASESKLVRDAAAFVKKDKLGKRRDAFLAKLGTGKRVTAVPVTGHPVDKPQLLAAAKQLSATYKAMPDKPGGIETLIRAMPDDLESYFDGLDEDGSGAPSFAVMLAVARNLRGGKRTAIKRDLELDDREDITVYYNNLEIGGDFEFGRNVVVLGDLTVGGTIADTREFLYLWVTGNVKARFVHCQHKAWIGGTLHTKLALLGRRGTLSVLGRITADLALRDDDEGRGFRGKLNAKHSIDTWAKDSDAQLAKLRSILVPGAWAELDAGLFDSERLVALAEKGKPYLRK